MSFKQEILAILSFLLLFSFSNAYAIVDSVPGIGIITPSFDKSTKSGYYIPEDLPDCMDELDKLIPDAIKDSLKTLDYTECYNRYGKITQWLTVNWGMFDNSRVVKYFDQFGFNDPAVIAHGIVKSYWNYLNGKPLRIEAIPKVYNYGQNLFLKLSDSLNIPLYIPNPKGTIISTDSTPQFIFMDRKFTLIDSLYEPIIKLISAQGFLPSDSLWYIWWTMVAKFGDNVDSLPQFVTSGDMDSVYSYKDSYNADYILIVEDGNIEKMQSIISADNYGSDFQDYVKSKKYFSFYLIRKREVHKFD